jgi:4-hydroxy-4-methyl-2-oxoglutarate aldolase
MNKELIDSMVLLIERNRISATEVSDALGKKGVLHGIQALNQGKFVSGKVSYIYGHQDSNWPLHEQAQHVEEGSIVYVDMIDCTNNMAAFGDLVTKYLILYKRVKGIVVNGLMRDIPNLRKNGYPVWCTGATPLGCYNRKVEETENVKAVSAANRAVFEGGILTCDDSGCTLISPDLINADTYKKLEHIELQEDIWYYCIDTLKWSTYETVCAKLYLEQTDVLPPVLKETVRSLNFEA